MIELCRAPVSPYFRCGPRRESSERRRDSGQCVRPPQAAVFPHRPRGRDLDTNRQNYVRDQFSVIPGDNASALEEQVEGERFRRFPCAELAKRDELNLDIRWLKDASSTDPDSLPPPGEVAAEIFDSLELALEKFGLVAAKLAASAPP